MAVTELVRIETLNNPAKNLSAAIECFLTYCRAKNLSENTLAYYGYRLEAFRRYVERSHSSMAIAEIDKLLIRDFVRSEIETCSPSTANHSVTTLRAFFGFLVREGIISVNPIIGVDKVRRKRELIETFTPDQLEAIMSTCGKDFVGVRDQALMLVLVDCGLRASEVCGLSVEDIDWKGRTIKVLGKGNIERLVSYGESTALALARYNARRFDVTARTFFVSCYGGPLNRYRLRDIIVRRCRQAGISGIRCSPHTFRHTFAVSYLRSGGDVFSLQKLLGHSDLTMTRRYCELSQTDALERHRTYSPADALQLVKVRKGRKKLV